MRLAVISDIHDNVHNLVVFMKTIVKHNVDQILFLGDFVNNGVAKILANSDIPVYAIWGNNDGDKAAITASALSDKSNLRMGFDTYDIVEFDNRKIFLTHYPMLSRIIATSGKVDAVFYGHDHKQNLETQGNCIIVNPGEISAHKTGKAGFAIYDTQTNEAKLHTLENHKSIKSDEVWTFIKQKGLKLSMTKSHIYK